MTGNFRWKWMFICELWKIMRFIKKLRGRPSFSLCFWTVWLQRPKQHARKHLPKAIQLFNSQMWRGEFIGRNTHPPFALQILPVQEPFLMAKQYFVSNHSQFKRWLFAVICQNRFFWLTQIEAFDFWSQMQWIASQSLWEGCAFSYLQFEEQSQNQREWFCLLHQSKDCSISCHGAPHDNQTRTWEHQQHQK